MYPKRKVDPASIIAEMLRSSTFTVVSRIVERTEHDYVLTLLNQSASVSATPLDLSAETSAGAKIVIIQLSLQVDSVTAGTSNYAYLQVRKNGTAATEGFLWVDGVGCAAGSLALEFAFCSLDAKQVLEYNLTIGGTIQVDAYIKLHYWIE